MIGRFALGAAAAMLAGVALGSVAMAAGGGVAPHGPSGSPCAPPHTS